MKEPFQFKMNAMAIKRMYQFMMEHFQSPDPWDDELFDVIIGPCRENGDPQLLELSKGSWATEVQLFEDHQLEVPITWEADYNNMKQQFENTKYELLDDTIGKK